MALGLHVFKVTTIEFLNRLHHFDSVTLNDREEFACWQEGSCNFYIVDDVLDVELKTFAEWIAQQHLELRLEKLCEKCGSSNTVRSEHSSKASDDRMVK